MNKRWVAASAHEQYGQPQVSPAFFFSSSVLSTGSTSSFSVSREHIGSGLATANKIPYKAGGDKLESTGTELQGKQPEIHYHAEEDNSLAMRAWLKYYQ